MVFYHILIYYGTYFSVAYISLPYVVFRFSSLNIIVSSNFAQTRSFDQIAWCKFASLTWACCVRSRVYSPRWIMEAVACDCFVSTLPLFSELTSSTDPTLTSSDVPRRWRHRQLQGGLMESRAESWRPAQNVFTCGSQFRPRALPRWIPNSVGCAFGTSL